MSTTSLSTCLVLLEAAAKIGRNLFTDGIFRVREKRPWTPLGAQSKRYKKNKRISPTPKEACARTTKSAQSADSTNSSMHFKYETGHLRLFKYETGPPCLFTNSEFNG
ncbi:hypothetical protein RUND412_006153 [Rhizina undulata]